MDRQSVRQRTKGHSLPRSTSLQLRYERERLELQKRVTEQLVSDVFGLYEKSLFVDLKLEASRGNVYCHQLFFAARVPALWHLLQEIAKFQRPVKKQAESLVCIKLPNVEYKELQKFTRSLYSDVSNRAAGVALRRKLEDTLAVLQQRALLHNNKIRIERLSSDEQHHVQRLILKQLQLGQLSEKRGNIQEVEWFISSNGVQYTYQTSVLSDTDSNSTVTVKPQIKRNSLSTSKSVRPKSSRKICAQKPKSLGNTMNITNHTVVNINKCEIKEKQQVSVSEEVCSNCDNGVQDDTDSSVTLTKKGKISLKGTLPTKRSSNDEHSPSGQLSNQESPVFNVSMIKELQTSPMQVSGESFQDKLRDKRDSSPSRSQRSSNSESTPIDLLYKKEKKSAIIYSNGNPGPFYPESVRVKEGKTPTYSAMSSSKENASQHQANVSRRQQQQKQQQPIQSVSTSKTYLQRRSHSFGAESQDSADLDNNSVSNSGSDHRLSNLHETSSLEVELPSSHEENSSSHDSDESPAAASKEWIPEKSRGEFSHEPSVEGKQSKTAAEPVDPKRPLVRARTFEILNTIGSGPSSEHPKESGERMETELAGSALKLEHGVSRETVNSHLNFSSPKRNIGTHGLVRDNPGNGKERNVADENVAAYHDSTDDPEKLREMERKKGSLIFEHNFQTYSNIPTTNMMTASMMTASMSSESGSMGVGSLYSSMMDSAMLGSIHSLGGLEAPVVDPIPRPASVGLPVMHSIEDANAEITHVSQRPPLRVQKSTEEMALELQQEIAKRGSATRSPSPDSLSVDFVARREAENMVKEKNTRKSIKNKSLETSTSSVKKEEMDDEEKEQDDRENESKRSSSSSNGLKSDKKEGSPEESSYKAITQITGSPRVSRELSENTPIVSGGSTLKREKDTGERTPIPKCERQVSAVSVKDVDSIPLVFGYIGPRDEDEEQDRAKEEAKEAYAEGEDEKHQSIFPMFIDLNDIPTPSAEEAKELEKREALKTKSQSSSVYMYIEADTPSPKSRRKRKSESDGAGLSKSTESHAEAEFISLPPVLAASAPLTDGKQQPGDRKADSKKVEVQGGSEEGGSKEKRGFFMFIEAEPSSKLGSPKLRKRPIPPPKKKTENAMTRSAPSDSILFSTPESSNKLMTKSVIDREEFIAQPPTRKNVSLNDKINESSTSRDASFVSGIPRPIHSLRSKGSSKSGSKIKPLPHKKDPSSLKDSSVSQTKEEHTSETNDMATSRDVSVSELGPSQSIPLSGISSASHPQENEVSEVSDVSSLLSSIERSNEPSDQGNKEPRSRLGEDLLHMFLNEINTDVTIQIGEKRIRAHKCILASRCVYFAAMLSGHWVESAGNIIKLQGFSHDSVLVALKHIYSGTSSVPEGVRVGELAALADMLALDGLKDVISLHLKAKMCHYFHKPCSGCLEGVLDVLPIAGAYCLDELYHRCLRWVAKHFVVVLPTRNYAALPPEVQDRCLKQLLDDMSVSNVIDTALGCERVLSSLPMVRWAQPVFDSAAQLLEAATSFIAANLSGVLVSDRFIALGRDSGWSIDSLQDTMRVACELIRPDQAVLSHIQLAKFLEQDQEDGLPEVSETFLNFLENLLNMVEKFMIHNANRVAVCRKWPMLSPGTQRRIKDAALVVVEFSRPSAPRPRLSSSNRRLRGSSSDGSGTPGRAGDHRLMRSASATAVPTSQRTGVRRPPASSQDPTRCQTPPASLSRPRTQTPPPTRASTLRAQARQAAIQRSQSARTVAERPRRPRQGTDTSTEEDTQSSNKRTTPIGGFTRGATFTRSLSRPDPGRPHPHTPARASGPSSSRPRTPGPESSQLPRRTTTVHRTPSHTTTGSSASEDEIPHRKSNTATRGQTLTFLNEGSGNETKLARTQSTELRPQTPTRRPEFRSSFTNLSKTGQSQQEGQPSPQLHSDSGSHTPRTPKANKTEPRRQIDVKNGNIITRSKGAVIGRRATRSPMRESGRPVGLATGRGTSPTPSATLASSMTGNRSRSSSVTSRPVRNIATPPPSVASRSNTFCKDKSTGPNQ